MLKKMAEQSSSPECLMLTEPLRDCYSSSNDRKMVVKRQPNNKDHEPSPKSRKTAFSMDDITYSSNFSAAEVLFLFDMDYMLYGKEINIEEMTAVEVLQYIFEFVSTECKNGNGEEINVNNVMWNGKTIQEIYNKILEEDKVLSWIAKNDNINYNKYSDDEYNKIIAKLKKKVQDMRFEYYMDMIKVIHDESKNGFENPDVMRTLFVHLRTVTHLPLIRLNGVAEYFITYELSEDIMSDYSGIFNSKRTTEIIVKPDLIFTSMQPLATSCDDSMDNIVLQVFCPQNSNTMSPVGSKEAQIKDYTSIRDKTPERNSCENKDNFVQEHHFVKPARTKDAIFHEKYKEQSRKYLSMCVPSMCMESHVLDKITGEHVLQLLGLAWHLHMNYEHNRKASGIFMTNQHMYFTKLSISPLEIFRVLFSRQKMSRTSAPRNGKVAYSRWKLDLALPNHRLALMVFLKEYLRNNK